MHFRIRVRTRDRRLRALVRCLLKQASGRQISLLMLGPDHEIATLVRQASEVTAKITPQEGARENTAYQFAQTLFFKQVIEADELLKLEVLVGILGGLKDECPKLRKDIMNWIAYLPVTDEHAIKDRKSVV